MGIFKDRVGHVYGKLTVIERDANASTTGKIMWRCICECGEITTVQANNLNSGVTKSCGAYHHRSIQPEDKLRLLRKEFGRYINHAAEKGVTFDITAERFAELCYENCHYCGKDGDTPTRPGRPKRNGVDCKDPNIGYTEENSLPCCFECNKAKGTMSYESFISMAKRIAARF